MSDRTVSQALEAAAAAARPRAGFTFVTDDKREEDWTFVELWRRARELAVGLREHGMKKGDRVALILPAANEFIPTFLGVVAGGGVPVPLYPPMGLGQLGGYLTHAQHIVGASRAVLVITTAQVKAVLGQLARTAPELRAILTVGDLPGDASLYRDPAAALTDPCFIQFTSGSTSAPKGVVVTHDNLSHNCRAIMRQGLSTGEEDRGLSWLPLFHDMGLIGFVIAPILYRVPVTFLSPMMFLKRPAVWLEYLSKHRGTITYGPNFAYAITTKRVKDADLDDAGVDLSCVRVAGCGAEPIQAETLRRFARRFGAWGFREQAFVPSYGMAEHTLAIAFASGIPTDVVRAESLWAQGRAEPAAAETEPDDAVEIVGCGRAFDGHAIRIVDVETRAPLPERRVGEIQLQGPSVMSGYFENAEKTRETIDAGGWLNTGDLGYLAEGRIFICGRHKDILIVNGKNYYPTDLEWAATGVDGIRAGNAIAFAAHRPDLGREAVVVVAESREADGREALATEVKTAIHGVTGLMVDEVVIVDVGTIPKTSSGKMQRTKARALFETGELKKREEEGLAKIAARVVDSQLAHLRLRIFGPRRP